ncbi:MAG: phosphoglucosamine mutase [Rhodomicrobium sp.]
MKVAYFGTDGIRGRANAGIMTCDLIMRISMAAGHVLRKGSHKPRAVIGKDTRLSGYMYESAIVAGLTSVGTDALLLGPAPTPAVALLTRSLRADVGIMISASHNPYFDNGIKLFGADGYKLPDEVERQIEELIEAPMDGLRVPPEAMGRAKRINGVSERYVEYAKQSLPRGMNFEGMRIVVDCANGAAHRVVPQAFWELGAEVLPIGVEPNGTNINDKCGSTDPQALCDKVKELRANIGIALDGDADRVLISDEHGNVVDGDQLLALIARNWGAKGLVSGGGVVSTVMANFGLERYLQTLGFRLERTPVGDRYVIAQMREHGFNIGGEPSGHIILSDYATTGDGFLTALQILACVMEESRPVSEVCKCFEPVPQRVRNISLNGQKTPLANPKVKKAIETARSELNGCGRLVVRPSGTEPVIRIMAEAENIGLVERAIDLVAASMESCRTV